MDMIEIKYTQETLDKMLHVNGVFAVEVKKLMYHIRRTKYNIFKPILPENMELESFKTIIDLAIQTPLQRIVLPDNPYTDSLQKRACTHTGGGLIILKNEGLDS